MSDITIYNDGSDGRDNGGVIVVVSIVECDGWSEEVAMVVSRSGNNCGSGFGGGGDNNGGIDGDGSINRGMEMVPIVECG